LLGSLPIGPRIEHGGDARSPIVAARPDSRPAEESMAVAKAVINPINHDEERLVGLAVAGAGVESHAVVSL